MNTSKLDQNDFSEIGKLRLFLLNDSLIVTKASEERQRSRKEAKLKFQNLYSLEGLPVVNVKERDMGTKKNCVKVMSFPEPRLFQV